MQKVEKGKNQSNAGVDEEIVNNSANIQNNHSVISRFFPSYLEQTGVLSLTCVTVV